MIRGYANKGQADKGYLGAIAEVLTKYPRSIALRSADINGVPRETKFLPTPADVIAWCERETAAMRKPVDTADHYAAIAEQSRKLADEQAAWEEKRKARPHINELRAKYGPNWGIQQHHDDPATKAKSDKQLAEANERAMLAEYAAAGIEPKRQPDGMLISLTLFRLIGGQALQETA